MMNNTKLFPILLATLISTPAIAGEILSTLPQGVSCISAGVSVERFSVQSMNTKKPFASFVDASTQDYDVTENTVIFQASNGCDNFYTLVLLTENLLKLKNGELKSVHGLLSYNNADNYAESESGSIDITVPVTCSLFSAMLAGND